MTVHNVTLIAEARNARARVHLSSDEKRDIRLYLAWMGMLYGFYPISGREAVGFFLGDLRRTRGTLRRDYLRDTRERRLAVRRYLADWTRQRYAEHKATHPGVEPEGIRTAAVALRSGPFGGIMGASPDA